MTTVPFRHKKSAASLVAQLRADEHAPMSAMIEIADRCNEVCVHCYQIQGQKGEMTTEQLEGVIDELADMGVVFLTISGGEATLRNDFLHIVEHARKRKFAVKLYTNGLRMTRELARSLAELAVQEVQISLYSHRAEMHDWVTRVPGSWEKTVAGIRYLREEGVAVVVKSPLMSFNAGEYGEWIDFVVGLGADYMLDPHVDPRENEDRDTEALRVDEATLLRIQDDERLGRAAGGPPPEKDLDKSLCGACSGNVHIEANGEMRPCTQLTVPVGNALTDGVQRAWKENREARTMRHLTWREVHGCRDCDLQPYCHRCFANAYTEGGDALGPYMSACHKARLQYRHVHGVDPSVDPGDTGRDPRLGPYREVARGKLFAIADVETEADRERARAHDWIRRPGGAAPGASDDSAQPGQLVQIRRPGRRKAKQERVPTVTPEPAATTTG
ncbi:MAG: radical SAM protein [Polyangiales bacterium]